MIISGVVTIIYALKHPKELVIEISKDGVSINGSLVDYKSITSFWLDETGKQTKLLILVKTSFVPAIALPLVGVSSEQVREALLPYSKEEEIRESRSIALFEKIGF